MIILKSKEVDVAMRGQQPGSSLTRSCVASVQRAPLVLQWWGDGSKDALSMLGARRHGRKMRARTKSEARGNERGRLKDC
jgi:hypothetical protein